MSEADILDRLRGYNPADRCSDKMQSQIAKDIARAAEEIGFLRGETERLERHIADLRELRKYDHAIIDRLQREKDALLPDTPPSGDRRSDAAADDHAAATTDTFERPASQPDFRPLSESETDTYNRGGA